MITYIMISLNRELICLTALVYNSWDYILCEDSFNSEPLQMMHLDSVHYGINNMLFVSSFGAGHWNTPLQFTLYRLHTR